MMILFGGYKILEKLKNTCLMSYLFFLFGKEKYFDNKNGIVVGCVNTIVIEQIHYLIIFY